MSREPGGELIGGDEATIRTEQHDAVSHRPEHGFQYVAAASGVLLGAENGGDVGDDGQVPAIGQRRGADVEHRAVRPHALAHLRPVEWEAHLDTQKLGGIARAEFAGFGEAAQDIRQMFADRDRRPLHDPRIGVVEHHEAAVGPIDAHAVRQRRDHRFEHGRRDHVSL